MVEGLSEALENFSEITPWGAASSAVHDCALYVCNSMDSECSVSECFRCKVSTHETHESDED